MSRAAERFRRFRGRAPEGADEIEIPNGIRDLVYLGRAVAVEYESDKENDPRTDGEAALYRHEFSEDVHLVTDRDGECLLILGDVAVDDWIE